MAVKLTKSTLPSGHSREDFEGTGPVVTKNTEWGDGCLCDLGCFKADEGTDSNKYYHLAVVKSKINGKWFAYYEWGRTKPDGRPSSPQFQFFDCSSKEDAQATCQKQFKGKNISRGTWEEVAGKQRFVPKTKKDGKTADLYVVRALATRLVGLPCCETIANSDAQGSATTAAKPAAKKTKKKTKSKIDRQTRSLFNDLLGGVQTYTQSFLGSKGGPITLPSQSAIDDSRDILNDALSRVGKIESGMKKSSTDQLIAAQVKDSDLMKLTKLMYGVIPKATRNPSPEDYILNRGNILTWQNDVDVLEQALHGADMSTEEEDDDTTNPLQGIPAEINYIPPSDPIYEWLVGGMKGNQHTGWWPNASRFRSGTGSSKLKIHGLWSVDRAGDRARFRTAQEKVLGEMPAKWNNERPIFAQEKSRPDLNANERKLFHNTNTSLMFHGTRSVNVPGICRENLRFPQELTGVVINGAMFGPGCYFADDWSKSAGYCSNPNPRSRSYYGGGGEVQKRHAFMFGFDVCLGNPHVADGSKGYRGSPTGTHCVFGKHGKTKSWGSSTLANNEWIIYVKGHCEMRYLAEIEW
mgnify:CR=1 FL=1|jgi:hypothetical protein